MPRFALEPIEMSFFDSAPGLYREAFEIQQPAEQVWTQLTKDNPLHWCKLLKSITWTSPRPFGVGTTRTARALGGSLVIDEEFIVWEEGKRKAFKVLQSNLPLFRRFGEDYLVEPTGETSCRFTWTIAAEPSPAGKPGAPINARIARSLFSDTRKHFGL